MKIIGEIEVGWGWGARGVERGARGSLGRRKGNQCQWERVQERVREANMIKIYSIQYENVIIKCIMNLYMLMKR